MGSMASLPPSTAEPRPASPKTAGGSSDGGHQPAAPGDTLGRYRLLKKIARGGMAEVFAARSFGAHGFEKTVAIKRILPRYGNDPQFVRMMVDEAKITVLLNHANVATILELCEQDGDYFIVMEFVPGQSLSALGKKLRERGERLGVLESCFMVVELLQGLHAAHVQKEQSGKLAHIVHRDVSPQNALVNFDGHVKVIDFGIARAKHRLELTEVGTIKGKLRYLAPEMIDPGRFMKSGDFDHRVDIFAAGIVLWEMIANRTLYQGDDEMVVYDAITDSDAPDLARLGMCDAALAKIIAKALVREPDARYLSAEAFADDLRAYVYRTDPAFTHKRIAAVMERLFPNEKEEMLSLERGSPPLLPDASEEKSEAAAEPAKVVSAHDPMPVAADAPTRTRASGPSDPRLRAAARESSRPTDQKPAATKQMRSADSSKKLSGEPKRTVIPVEDGDLGAGPGQGDVLTVMTLVSKSGGAAVQPQGVAGEGKRDFKAGSDTVTASDEPNRKAPRLALDGPAERGPESAVDETPHTSERSRSLSQRHRQSPAAVRPRLLALAAASGVGIALIAVVAMEMSSPSEPERPALPRLPPAAVKVPVRLVVTSPSPNATVIVAGEERAVPATFSVLAGDTVPVIVRAPFHGEKSARVSVPRPADGAPAGDQVLDISLDPDPVPLTLTVTPKGAVVEVGEESYREGMMVRPGQPLMIQASAPGFTSVRKEIEPQPGKAVIEVLDLKPDNGAAAKLPPPVLKDREREKARVVSNKPATLMIKTKPVWGEVTIDGRKYEETTPLQVSLAPGKHTVVVTHPPKGFKKSFTITLKAGESESKTISFE